MIAETLPAVRKSLQVNVPRERAFTVFTEQIGTWWPASHHIGQQPFADVVIEDRPGGRCYERAADGTECDWGRVLEWDPPERLVLAWHLGTKWKFDPDPARASEVEVRFYAESTQTTRVELEHRGIERHGKGADTMRQAVDSPGGWTLILESYGRVANG